MIVIDVGSDMVRVGRTGDQEPRVTFAPLVTRKQGKVAVGEEGGNCPLKGGVVTNWDDMEQIYRHAYVQLGVAPSSQSLIITNSSMIKIGDSIAHDMEKAAQILFNKMNIPAVFPAHPAVMSLYASGKLTGLVVQSGEGLTQVVPVVNGYAIKENIITVAVNGADLTEYLKKLMVSQNTTMAVYKDIKERLCFVSLNPAKEGDKPQKNNVYKLPDDTSISLGNERFQCPEALFNPSVIGKSSPSLPEAIFQTVSRCNVDKQKELFANILLSGGNALLQGLPNRVKQEVRKLSGLTGPSEIGVKVSSAAKESAFTGACILAGLDQCKDLPVSKEKYEKEGLKAFVLDEAN